MRSWSSRRTFTTSAAMVSGLMALLGAAPVYAQQPAAPAKPAAAAPAKPAGDKAAAGKPAGDKAAADKPAAGAKPADKPAGDKTAAAKPAKPLTEKQKKDAATKAYKAAQEKFTKGDYAGALEGYREADTLLPGERPKFQIAVSLDKLGKVQEAVAAYQIFLDAKPDAEKLKDQIAEANARMEALKKTPAKVKLAITPEAPAGMKVKVDGVDQPLTAGNELSLAPGKHKITVTAEGFEPSTQDIELKFAETREVPLALTKKAEPPPAPPPVAVTPPPPPVTTPPPPVEPPKPRSKIPAYVTLGLAGAGAVVGTIFGIQALSAKSDFEAAPSTDAADRADRNALIADMSYAVAITFGVTGAVLLFSKDTPEEPKPATGMTKPTTAPRKAFVTPYAGPNGGGAAALITF
jgi:hypothetical protein